MAERGEWFYDGRTQYMITAKNIMVSQKTEISETFQFCENCITVNKQAICHEWVWGLLIFQILFIYLELWLHGNKPL